MQEAQDAVGHLERGRLFHLSEIPYRLAALGLSLGALATFSSCAGADPQQLRAAGHSPVEQAAQTPDVPAHSSRLNVRLGPPNRALQNNDDEVLKGLGRLESESHARLFHGAMQFFGMPKAINEIGSDIDSWHPASLTLAHEAGVKPLVVFEPDSQDVAQLATNRYDATVERYYKYLAENGVTAKTIGTVVLMPELLVGGWRDAHSADFPAIVNHQADLLHAAFPKAQATTMIDLQASESGPLLAQLPAVGAGKLTSIGVQAFSDDERIHFKKGPHGLLVAGMSSYMKPGLIAQISQKAGNLPVWINTGIPGVDNGIHYSTAERLAVARGIVETVRQVQARGVKVNFVNLFAQDKSLSEKINFDFTARAAKAILPGLARGLKASGVELYGFTATPS